ncbi:hypothetical protein KC354_g12978 [Hortaea werneckii]|nr:hypothetical protein KC354_g12978 [Hortaea werneckii]
MSAVLQQNKFPSYTGMANAILEREARRQETYTAKVTSFLRNLYPVAKLTAGLAKDVGGGALPAAGAVGAGLGCLFELLMKPRAQTEIILDSLQSMSGSTRLLQNLHDVPSRDLDVDVLLAALHLSTALTRFLEGSLMWLDKGGLAKFGSVALNEDRLKAPCAEIAKARQDLNEAMQNEAFFMAKQLNLESQEAQGLAKICKANEQEFHLAKQVLLRDCRLPSTGTLFLDQEFYTDFRGGETRLLWCTGMRKTYIASAIIDDLEIYSRHRDVGLAYVFFERGREQLQDDKSAIAALTWQLMARKPELLLKSKQLLGNDRMSNLERKMLFCQACSSFEHVFLVVDALDELSAEAKAKKPTQKVHIRASEDDIRTLVEVEAEQNPDFLFCESQDPLLRYDVVQNVVERSGRIIGRISDLSLGSVEFNGRSSNDIEAIPDRADADGRGLAPMRKYRVFDHVVTAAHETVLQFFSSESDTFLFGNRVSPLDFAVLNRQSEMAQLLLTDVDPDVDDHQHHQILLRLALEHADAPISRVILQEGAVNVNEPSCHTGVTPLGLLLRPLTYFDRSVDETKQIFATMDVLMAHSQLNINAQEAKTGEGAVHFVPRVPGIAALQLLERLVRAGIDDYNATTLQGTTVLMLSSWLGRADVVTRLLELSDSQADAVDVCQRTALHYACIPVKYRVSPWEQARSSASQDASQHRDCSMVLRLLHPRALDINARDNTGRTPLAWACLCTKADFIAAKRATMEAQWARHELWPEAGINELYDHTRPDPHAFQVAVAFLLDAGADPHITDKAGHAPLDHANAMLSLANQRLACALEFLRTSWDPQIDETHLPLSNGVWEGLFDRPDTPSVDGIMLDSVDLDLFLPVRALRHIIDLLKSKGAQSSNPYAPDPSACFGMYPSRRHSMENVFGYSRFGICIAANGVQHTIPPSRHVKADAGSPDKDSKQRRGGATLAAQQNHGTSKLAAAQGGAVAVANYSQQHQQAGPGAPPPGGQQAGGYPGKPSYQAYPGGAAVSQS